MLENVRRDESLRESGEKEQKQREVRRSREKKREESFALRVEPACGGISWMNRRRRAVWMI